MRSMRIAWATAPESLVPAPLPQDGKVESPMIRSSVVVTVLAAALCGETVAVAEDPTRPGEVSEVGATSPLPPAPSPRAGGSWYMNISFDLLVDFGWSTTPNVSDVLNLGDHDPVQRGFTIPNSELVFEGAVDPYFKGLGDVVLKLDEEGETSVELEEAYFVTTSLPGGLQIKGGQFFTEFGRLNPRHPHQWDFVDQPLALNRAFGPDGLRSPGAQVSWLAPTPFYMELLLGVLNGTGETAWSFLNPEGSDFHGRATVERDRRGLQDMLYVPRVATSFETGNESTLLLGASAALGPNNSGTDADSRVYGADAFWKWRPANAMKGFPFFSVQGEALYRHFEAGADPIPPLPEEILRDWGYYAQILWGFRPRWVAGLRGESVGGDPGAFSGEDVWRADRTRVAPNLTWYPTEFSKLRLQYNYDRGEFFGTEHSLWFQMEVLLGAHGTHKF